MPILVTITGPIAAGKNTVADLLAENCVRSGRTVVIADVDGVAAMVGAPGAGAAGLWFAAHQAHGALVGQWMQSNVDVVISVGPIYTQAERDALFGQLPPTSQLIRVLIDAPLSATWQRVTADKQRGASRQRHFHESAHARYRSLMPDIPTDLTLDSGDTSAADIAATILRAVVTALDRADRDRPWLGARGGHADLLEAGKSIATSSSALRRSFDSARSSSSGVAGCCEHAGVNTSAGPHHPNGKAAPDCSVVLWAPLRAGTFRPKRSVTSGTRPRGCFTSTSTARRDPCGSS